MKKCGNSYQLLRQWCWRYGLDHVTPKSQETPIIRNGSNRRLEFELGAWFEGSCGFALVLALSQMMEHGLGPFGRADLHPRRNPLDQQGRFAPQPGSDGSKDE
jgi:hypothetical protein